MTEMPGLTGVHLDVLREIGNIGAGNAATALAQLVRHKILMEVPKAEVMELKEIFNLVGNEEDVVACTSFRVAGQAPACILFMLAETSAYALVDVMLGKADATSGLDEMGISVLQEVGNILTGSFLGAFAQLTGLNFIPDSPALAFDMLGAVLSAALVEAGFYADQILVIETHFIEEEKRLNSYFFLLPEAGSLATMMRTLGINV